MLSIKKLKTLQIISDEYTMKKMLMLKWKKTTFEVRTVYL